MCAPLKYIIVAEKLIHINSSIIADGGANMEVKLLLLLVGLISGFCLVHTETIETWGDLYNVRAVDHRIVKARGFVFHVKNRTMTFPPVIMANECVFNKHSLVVYFQICIHLSNIIILLRIHT